MRALLKRGFEMQHRCRCEEGHEWTLSPNEPNAGCPVCGTREVEILQEQELEATLDAPATFARASQNENRPHHLRSEDARGNLADTFDSEVTGDFAPPETREESHAEKPTADDSFAATLGTPPSEVHAEPNAPEKDKPTQMAAPGTRKPVEGEDEPTEMSDDPVDPNEPTLLRSTPGFNEPAVSRTPKSPLSPLEKAGDFHEDTYVDPEPKKPIPKICVPGYEILQELGRGGMGVVYKARQIRANRLTALKMILSGAHASQTELARFRSEGQAVAALQHPNIVQIYEVGEHDGRPFFSLEFVDGGNLADKLLGTPLSPREAAETMFKLADAMDSAHKRGIIHRDLKPANVLLTRGGDPKITDFGLAKSLDDDSGQTGTGAILGTPSYMSPEQARGDTKHIGPTADIYSLGAMLYDMLTGRPPFRGQTLLDTLQQVQKIEPVSPRRLQPEVPRDLDVICLKCLQKEPERRYSSAGELAADLKRYLDNEPILARPVSTWEHVFKWAKRNPVVASLIACLCVVLVGGLVGMTALWLKADVERRSAISARNLADENAKKAKEKEREAKTNAANALREKLKAIDAEKAAKTSAKVAREAEQKEKAAKKVAQRNYETARHNLYVKQISSAQDELASGRRNRAKQILRQLAKHKEGESDLRGFEWYYLNRLCTSEQLRLRGHIQKVTHVAFSADGRWVATASLDRSIKIWDVDTGKVLKTLDGHKRPIRALTFAPNDEFLASAGSGGTIYIWNPKTGKHTRPIKAHDRSIRALAITPDGSRLASCSDDRTIKIWDVKTRKLIRNLNGKGQWHKYPITCLAFGRKGALLAAGDEGRRIRVWDTATGEVGLSLKGHKHWVSSLTFSRNGTKLASGSWDRTVRIWDMAQKQRPVVLRGHEHPVRGLAFNPEATKLASVDSTNTVKVWNLRDAVDPQTLPGQPGSVRTVSFSRDGQFLAAVRFGLPSDTINPIVALHNGPITCLGLMPHGKMAVSGGSGVNSEGDTTGELIFWDVASQESKNRITIPDEPVRVVAVSPEGSLVACGTEGSNVHVIEPGSPAKRTLLKGHSSRVLSLNFHPSEKWLASASADSTVKIWDVKTQKIVRELKGHKGPVRSVRFSPDGRYVASAGVDRVVRIWKTASGKLLHELKGHEAEVNALAFHPNDNILASGSDDNLIVLWNYVTGKRQRDLRGHDDSIRCLVFSAKGKRLASGSSDRLVKLWDIDVGLATLTVQGHTAPVTGLVFTPDNTRLLSASEDQTVQILEAPKESL